MNWANGIAKLRLRMAAPRCARWSFVLAAFLAATVGGCSGNFFWVKKASTYIAFFPERFPGPSDFVGTRRPQPTAVLNGLQSTYNGTAFVGMLDKAEVTKVLPFGFSLANQITVSNKHPVIFLIGDQREPSFLEGGNVTTICQSCGYKEMILLVPFVVRDPDTRWHNYAVRMYLDDWSAVVGGNSIYGYAKQYAFLIKTEQTGVTKHEIYPVFGGLIFRSEVELTGPWVPVSQSATSVPRWADLEQILKAPVLGQQPSDDFKPLALICSYWEWDFANAEVAPAASKHQIARKFRDGMENWVSATSVPNVPDGAVSMRGIRWRLAEPPEGCQPP